MMDACLSGIRISDIVDIHKYVGNAYHTKLNGIVEMLYYWYVKNRM